MTAYIQYENLPTEELLRRAEQHTDPLVRAMAHRMDEINYQLRVYRGLLGMPVHPSADGRQRDLFEGEGNEKAV